MKLWNKKVAGVTVLTMSLLLAACSGDEESTDTGTDAGSDTGGDEGTSEEEVTITYARGVDVTNATDALIAAFEEQNPNINVEYREMPADTGAQHDQYVTILGSQSSEIDVFQADVIWPAEFAQAQYALELDRFIEQDGINLDDYFPGTIQSGNFNGRQYAMPQFTDAGLLYYRTDIVDTPPATWTELIEMAGSLQGEGETEFGYLMQANQYEGMVTNAVEFIASHGGEIINENNEVVVDSPETVAGIQTMIDIVNSEFVPSNILSFQETETNNAWVGGQAVFARNWPYMQATSNDEEVSEVAGNVGFSVLPAAEDGTNAATLGGWMAMINRYSENQEAAWEFVKFITGPEGQKISAQEGGLAPTIESLYEDAEVQEAAPIFAQPEFVETLQNAVPRPVTPIYPRISDIMQVQLSRALAGEITAEEAAATMQEEMEAAIAE
ncbi:ABC transporter substrate-binding protein [Jeotgalibacillus haloalkalitolerans]|uniref:ABC transporter substrate-binding protein n=1 Tax=Jeotgalibacillus haloalkalitolerans TaxID=3104292 RepID=A0ABU5KJH9_9BACL|nr:ABC transporter substrate-binding protein [Jeotgalibacillus sp. HH7-29]MDZ5711071.1 ABC transporter substrate-binding protein [Jeotgalibacillus sp. HH7-29]